MKTFTYTITDQLGIHARPAGLLVKAVTPFKSKITLSTAEKQVDARRIMAVMGLGAKQGTVLTVSVEGEDEELASKAIEEFLKANL